MPERRQRAEAGVSLISTIVMLVTIGVMSAIVVKALPKMGKTGSPTEQLFNEINGQTTTTKKGDGTTTIPAPTATTVKPAAPGPGGMFASARTSECRIAVRTLRTAMEAAKAQSGAYPTQIKDLVTMGMLSGEPQIAGYTFTVGVPDDSGAKVLVNGQPNDEACLTPAPASQ